MSERDARVQARRAIEALRAGVPNRDAVVELGSAHATIEERFREQLAATRQVGAESRHPTGFLIAGNFGTGKSHLLEYLRQIALAEHFVVSTIVISKETPLYDPVKLFRSAIRSASVPGRVGAALPQIASELQFTSDGYTAFYRWVQDPRQVNGRFAASVYLFEHARQDPELLDRVISFWSGDPIQIGELKRALRELGQASAYTFDPITQVALAYQRCGFAARLMLAAGYAGWVLLFDEVDLVGRYSVLQRAKSYAQIARWTGNLSTEQYPGISSVMAITSAFEAEIMERKNDREAIPGRLNASPRESDQLVARQAERGMRLIDSRKMLTLTPPADEVVDATYTRVRAIHGRAYDWEPPQIVWRVERARSTRMREYVRSWINEWDLRRLDAGYQPSIEVGSLSFTYDEDVDLEAPVENDREDHSHDV
jgi:hypothetical protein